MRQREAAGQVHDRGAGRPGMPIEPRVSSTQSRATIMQSSAKLS